MLKKPNTKKDPLRRPFRIAGAVFVVICLVVGIACFQYYRRLQDTVTNESRGYLLEISTQISSNVNRIVKESFSVLDAISNVIRDANYTSYDLLDPLVKGQQDVWNYRSVLFIGPDGSAHDTQGYPVVLPNEQYLRDAVVGGMRSMSGAQVVDGNECLIFVLPVKEMTIGGKSVIALAATFDISTFEQTMSMSAFDGKGYCSINQQDGALVVRSSSEHAIQSGYNTLSTLSTATVDGGRTMDEVRADIAAGKSDVVGLTYNGQRLYMAYSNLDTGGWCLLTFVPMEVVNAKSQMLIQLTLLLCGGITLLFAVLLSTILYSSYRHQRRLEQIAYVDPVTGGDTIQRFYQEAENLLQVPNRSQYALIYLNVEKFKVLNEQYGRLTCDDMLKHIQEGISANLSSDERIGRISADNFCILVLYSGAAALIDRLDDWYAEVALRQKAGGGVWLSPIMAFGVYVVTGDPLPFPQMIDRAKLALRESANELRGRVRCAVYDDAVRRTLFREKQLEDMMQDALDNREFTVYLQPKYRAKTERIGGAEALVRWKSTSEGMIYPDEFISLFEKNGFITHLDLYVFEVVCRTIRSWLDAGLTPVKVSVNCSRVHLRNPNFLDCYLDICSRCNTPPEYIEIELTENLVFEDVAHLSDTIEAIHRAGFGCSMDDFGSGYSSLNLIQDIPVDTIKLDKVFFQKAARGADRTEAVVGSILNMTRSLNMEAVAEGVEERLQVEMLQRLGCDYIQGYYFAKPMPISEFETLAFGRMLDDAEKAVNP